MVPSASGGIARLACAEVRKAGMDPAEILAEAGVTMDEVADPAGRLPVPNQIDILNRAAVALGDDFLGFHMALGYDLREIGLVYYIMASSQDLSDALSKLERYSAVVNQGVRISFGRDGPATVSLNYVNVDRHSDRHQVEFWMVSLMRICRKVTDTRLAAARLKFRHQREATSPEFKTFFGSDVEFGADGDTMTFAPQAVSLPVVGHDTFLNGLLRQYADDALSPPPTLSPPTLRGDIEKIMPELLPHGGATADAVARKLGMSARTLSRKLRQEGISYPEILDDLRSCLARTYISDHRLPVSEVAWLLGYREVSSLTHAFKRWTGMTPRQFRSSRGGKGAGSEPASPHRSRSADG
jgi:AraC-like DNA-binding protein